MLASTPALNGTRTGTGLMGYATTQHATDPLLDALYLVMLTFARSADPATFGAVGSFGEVCASPQLRAAMAAALRLRIDGLCWLLDNRCVASWGGQRGAGERRRVQQHHPLTASTPDRRRRVPAALAGPRDVEDTHACASTGR